MPPLPLCLSLVIDLKQGKPHSQKLARHEKHDVSTCHGCCLNSPPPLVAAYLTTCSSSLRRCQHSTWLGGDQSPYLVYLFTRGRNPGRYVLSIYARVGEGPGSSLYRSVEPKLDETEYRSMHTDTCGGGHAYRRQRPNEYAGFTAE